ncbi:hypothetical protein MCUN1_003011 [Malassezia cuniculi]|uniref:Dolichol-phosphate mannosyltransferase subunit 3 n=1 Tax=Malassezia cuniculi TaxID=948313 RepID=A0AAF0JCP9_9BASI|nr:hypothetical protein MCUN1_003011 [Malassezia cuniculi]
MTRATRFVTIAAATTLIYLVFALGIIPVPLISASVADKILPTLPWWVLVSTGSYLLFQVGWGIFHFNNVPKAHDELLMDIKTAKDFLRERGVTVD